MACAVLLAVVVAYGLHALIVSGPEMHAAAQALLKLAVADEDRNVCGQLGIREGTPQSVVCSRELANVRQRQTDRDRAVAAGLI